MFAYHLVKKTILFLLLAPLFLLAGAPPSPASDLTLTPSSNSVTLSWHDNSDDEVGFKIFRDGELIHKTTRNIQTYVDKGVTPNKNYVYTVFSFNNRSFGYMNWVNTNHVSIKTENPTLLQGQGFDVSTHYAEGNAEDWIGIYPTGSTNDWANVIKWVRTDGKTSGKYHFDGLPVGTYDVRIFYNNTYASEATYSFVVKNTLERKRLLLAGGDSWSSVVAANFINNYEHIKNLPFDGYMVQGGTFTNEVMGEVPGYEVTYDKIWREVGALQNLYHDKDNFLLVWINLSGDLWDDAVWHTVAQRFAIIAKVAKDLGFKGIAFDNEGYGNHAKKMINFHGDNENAAWSYKNPDYDFFQHMEKVTDRYQEIMQAMVQEFTDIEVLVYHTPALSHKNYNHLAALNTTDQGQYWQHDFLGPMFLGFKRGLNATASLHDMGEMYKYRMAYSFENSYQFRKYQMAWDSFNDALEPFSEWQMAIVDRATYASKVNVGFMVSNSHEGDSLYPAYDTKFISNYWDIKVVLTLSLDTSDKYVLYYTRGQDWLLPDSVIPIEWKNMMQDIYER